MFSQVHRECIHSTKVKRFVWNRHFFVKNLLFKHYVLQKFRNLEPQTVYFHCKQSIWYFICKPLILPMFPSILKHSKLISLTLLLFPMWNPNLIYLRKGWEIILHKTSMHLTFRSLVTRVSIRSYCADLLWGSSEIPVVLFVPRINMHMQVWLHYSSAESEICHRHGRQRKNPSRENNCLKSRGRETKFETLVVKETKDKVRSLWPSGSDRRRKIRPLSNSTIRFPTWRWFPALEKLPKLIHV